MAKKSQQRPARQKKDTSGCMWGIISMFDFRHGRTPRRLLSDRRRYTDNNTHGKTSCLPLKQKNLCTCHECGTHKTEKNIIQRVFLTDPQDDERIIKPTFDLMRTRVKEVNEEKMFVDQDPKSIRKNHKHMNTSKTLKMSFDEEITFSHQAQKTSQYHDLEALVREILLIYRKRNEQHGDIGTGQNGSFPIVEEKLIAAVEALLNEKSRNRDYKKFHHFKEMFQMLSSNREMFLKIIQDQNLILLNEDQKSKSKGQGRPEEPLVRKHRKISRRSKSQESITLNKNDRIVILKPGWSENQVPMGTETHSDENGSQFSFMKVKTRLNQAKRTGKTVDGGWSSPNRDHFYTERFAKITNGLTRGDGFSKSLETEIKSDNSENKTFNIYVEAKKHLSEMLTSGDEDAESMKRSLPALPKSLGRILSLREYNSLSHVTSPRGQPRPLVNKCQFIMTSEDSEGKMVVLDDVTCEGDQEIVESPSCDREHAKQTEGCLPRNSLTEDQPSESLEPVKKNYNFYGDLTFSLLFLVKQDLPEKNELFSSPDRNEHSLSCKTEEHETSPGKPSPISVLEPLFSDDDTTPARRVSLPVETTVQPRCIKFDELVSSTEDQQIRITDSGDNEESAFEYVEAVLLSSDLNWSEFETRWISSVQILDPFLFEEVETFSSRPKHDQKLLFDSTNEALEDVCKRFIPESSVIKQNVRPVPKGMELINEVWSRLESCLCKVYPRDLDELVRNDLETSRVWLDLRTGSREVVIELEESIFEETIDDIVLSLFTDR
ncbi:hypothetical protein SSX86_004736 [Deinandra increscens subsp. villosa]|uniref:DUF4378 domain-containing protein n=1 Tax=Deinandra increscens subsp. villosa TaxID=3103831 RepID=A0AAP0DP52_9ASTR